METNEYRLREELCTMPSGDADRLIKAADGDCALLYIYLLRRGSGAAEGDIARELGMETGRLRRAASKLRAAGLMPGAEKPQRRDELPEYDAREIVSRAADDRAFREVLGEAERVLGRTLSAADTRTLFGIYDYLGLPTEVILLLLHCCADECRERYGPGRVPTMRQVESEAYIWANREVMTYELAEEFLRLRQETRGDVEALRLAFGIRDRALTPTERKYLEGWLGQGFPRESLELAYDRTVTNTGSLRWNYMNKIVQSWFNKGLRTPEEIERGDAPARSPARGQTPASTASTARPTGEELRQLEKLYDKVKNK